MCATQQALLLRRVHLAPTGLPLALHNAFLATLGATVEQQVSPALLIHVTQGMCASWARRVQHLQTGRQGRRVLKGTTAQAVQLKKCRVLQGNTEPPQV